MCRRRLRQIATTAKKAKTSASLSMTLYAQLESLLLSRSAELLVPMAQNNGKELCYKVYRWTPLRHLVECHCQQLGDNVDPRMVSLRIDGRLLNLSKTPRYHNLADLNKLGRSVSRSRVVE